MAQPPKFDKLSFIKYMKNIGRAYRKQATELVLLCRTFVQAQEQTPGSDAKLRSALESVDAALESATKAEKKTSRVVDERFEKAINALIDYEMDCHRKIAVSDGGRRANSLSVRERMDPARAKDKSSSTTLNALKEKSRMKPIPEEWSEPTKVVDFLLFESLPDEAPVVVQQVLGKSSNVAEILWNFNRCKGEKRITLKQNPHFYKGLPREKEAYGDDFRSDPIESFLDTPEVFVLTDRPSRVYLQSGQDARAFGNVWLPNDAIIFKDVCGKLEGESIVGAPIQNNHKVRYRVEPLQPAATSTHAVPWEPLQDWREPIRRTLNTKNISIHISAEEPKSIRSLRVSSSTSSHSTLGSLNQSKQATSGTALYTSVSSAQTQPHPALTARVPLGHVASQSASLSPPSLTTSPSTDSATSTPDPVLSYGTPQSASASQSSLTTSPSQLSLTTPPSLTTSSSTDSATSEPVPSHRTLQSASLSQPPLKTSPPTDSAILEPAPSHRTSESASPSQPSLTISLSASSATPEPVPSHGISQPASSYQPSSMTLMSMTSAAPEPVPSTVSTPRSATGRQDETPNISEKPDSDALFPPSVTATSQSVKANPPAGGKNVGSGGNAHVQSNVTSVKLEATKLMPLKSDGKPPLQSHATQPAQRQGGWQFWFQGSVWRR